ncbi:MAG TPA: AAA family ATPase [Terriglobales bacterium]|nr:AAA family ATPase [Terriglobales bacterium]
MIVIMAGLPGTGKSTLARALASRLSGRILSKDEVRQALFSESEIEYSTAQDDFVMQAMLRTAEWIVRKDPARVVFLDGRPFSRRYQLDLVLKTCAEIGQRWCILECICSEEIARKRIEEQSAKGEHPAGNRDVGLYQEVKARFEPITLPKTVIDTDLPLETCEGQALAAIRSAEAG